jgi:hypothetical protein
MACNDFTAAGMQVFLENKGVVDAWFKVEKTRAETESVEESAGKKGPDFLDVGGLGRAAEGRDGLALRHAAATQDFLEQTADTAPREREKEFGGREDKEVPENEGLAEGSGDIAV